MSSLQTETPYTLFKSNGLWLLNKPPRKHFDELITHSATTSSPEEPHWEAAHRLDYETSGCLLFAEKSLIPALRAAFKNSNGLRKVYWAGAVGELPQAGQDRLIRGFIGSRYRSSKKVKFSLSDESFQGYHSVQETEHRVKKVPESVKLEFFENSFAHSEATPEERRKTLDLFAHTYEIELISGARHQIRAFFESFHVPLKGDPIYGRETNAERLALHAKHFEIQKDTGLPTLSCEAPWYWNELK